MEEKLTNEDKNNNGIPDWYEERLDDQETFLEGPLGRAYSSEEKIAAKIPNYKDYKWYKNPVQEGHLPTGYFYTLGEKIENAIESNPDESIETMNEMVEQDSAISKEDIKPLVEEAEQVKDGGKDAEVNNEEVEKAVKKLGSFLPDLPEREISQKEYDEMSIDDIAAQDELAMKGEGDYLTVANEIGLDENDLYYFEDPSFVASLTEEQKEEIKNEPDKEKKIGLLNKIKLELPKVSLDVSGEGAALSSEQTNPIEENPVTSKVAGTSISAGGSGGAGISAGSSIDSSIEKDSTNPIAHSQSADTDLNVRDESDVGSQFSTASNKGIDDTLDSLSFDKTEHQGDIKPNEQFELNGKEGHTAEPAKAELPKFENKTDAIDYIKKVLLSDSSTWENGDSKEKFLPFRFVMNGSDIIVSQIGTARKLPFDDFIKKEPTAIQYIMEKL